MTNVLTIGWRGSEKHFLSLWEEAIANGSPANPPPALAVGGHGEVAQNLASIGIATEPSSKTFSSFIAEGELRRFLA